jgi:protein MpaA
VNFDGDAEAIAEQISKIIKYPIAPSIGYPTPGSFGTWAGLEKNIPTITLELDEEIEIEELKEPVFKIFKLLEDYDCGKD